jgi:hypothetical protein
LVSRLKIIGVFFQGVLKKHDGTPKIAFLTQFHAFLQQFFFGPGVASRNQADYQQNEDYFPIQF